MHNIEQKTSKAKWKERMTKWTKSHVLTLGPTQDFKCVWWKLKIILEMMLEKEWSCNFFEMFSWSQFIPFFTNCPKRGTQATTSRGKSSCANLKCVYKGNKLELSTFIASNKNGWWSNQNLRTMISVTNA